MCQACDYNDVNDAVRFGYHLYLGPGRYMASMADEQTRSLSGYVKEVLGIWQQLRATLFDGELLDTLEVQVVASGEILHTTHRNPTTGKRACVLVNAGDDDGAATVSFEGDRRGQVTIYEPFREPWAASAPVSVRIRPERLAVVVEA